MNRESWSKQPDSTATPSNQASSTKAEVFSVIRCGGFDETEEKDGATSSPKFGAGVGGRALKCGSASNGSLG